MNHRLKYFCVALASIVLLSTQESKAYEVWMGTMGIGTNTEAHAETWEHTASLVEGLNVVIATHEAGENSELSHAEATVMLDRFPNKNTHFEPFPRSNWKAGTTIAEELDSRLERAQKRGLTLDNVMLYNNANDTTSFVWLAEEVQAIRDYFDSIGREDIGIMFNVRAFKDAAKAWCLNPNVDDIVLEAGVHIWESNKGKRRELLQWIWSQPELDDKRIIFQIPTRDEYEPVDNYMSIRRLVQWLGSDLMGWDFLRSDRVIFEVLSYHYFEVHPETDAPDLYANTRCGVVLSLIEQRDLFEARTRVPTIADADSKVRTIPVPPTLSSVEDQMTGEADGPLVIPFTIWDFETPLDNLILNATSSNTNVVSASGLVLGGSGSNRTVTITANPGQLGIPTTISLSVLDGSGLSASRQFLFKRTTGSLFTAVATGDLNDAATWDGSLPSAGDTNTWCSAGYELNMATDPETFNAGTLWLNPGGSLIPRLVGPKLNLNHLVLDGGSIRQANNGAFTLNLNGGTCTLNAGGLLPNTAGNNRHLIFQNGVLAGAGTITVQSTNGGKTNESYLTMENSIDTSGFTGVFDVYSQGKLELPAIDAADASFGLRVSGTGQLLNNTDIHIHSLELDGELIPAGTYQFSDFTASQQALLYDNGGTITVSASPTISDIADLMIEKNQFINPIPFMIDDADTAVSDLALSSKSSDPILVPPGNIVFSGSGTNRTLVITPASGLTGTTTIEISVSDGPHTTTETFELTVIPAGIIIAIENGDLSADSTWDRPAPQPGDSNVWKTGEHEITTTSTNFHGSKLVVQDEGSLRPLSQAELYLNDLALDGGLITYNHNISCTLLINGVCSLQDGTLKSGDAETGRNLIFDGGTFAGKGLIHVLGSSTTSNSAGMVRVNSNVDTSGFSGIFHLHDNGRLDLSDIPVEKVSFGVRITGTGKYRNDANVALASLVIENAVIPPGVYAFDDFTPAQQQFIEDNGGTITVVGGADTPPTISAIPDQFIDKNGSLESLGFTVNDAELAVEFLSVTGRSSNIDLVSEEQIEFAGTGTNRTLTVTPQPDQYGMTTISVIISDGVYSTTNSFKLNVLDDTAFAQWAYLHNLSGNESDDDDEDGVSDFIEYALNGNPTNPADRGYMPHLVSVQQNGTNALLFMHAERTDDSNLTFRVEVSDSLVEPGWSTNGLNPIGVYPWTVDYTIVTNQVTDTAKSKQFIRLMVNPD